jgi:hypothetical protein
MLKQKLARPHYFWNGFLNSRETHSHLAGNLLNRMNYLCLCQAPMSGGADYAVPNWLKPYAVRGARCAQKWPFGARRVAAAARYPCYGE